ncbi:MAG TPA: ABC transporter permease [Candidatus Limnocylindria bacterium]|jgi:oligopeptide transport system permease protein|nr:ABC transporter permease [Candidatus Limnocylindria bacterium]
MATQTGALEAPAIRSQKPTSLWRDAMGRLVRNRLAVLGAIIVGLLIIVGLFGPVIAPYPYYEQNIPLVQAHGNLPLAPGTAGRLLGTDLFGRDLLSRLLDGARISLSVAVVVQFVVLFIGVPIGAVAGWFGGRIDTYLMRFTDVIYAFPDLLLIILMTVTLRDTPFGSALDGLLLVYVAIGLVAWVTMARLVRGQLLSLKETEYVEAARAIGVSDRRIVIRHLLPNAIGPVIVAVTLGIPGAILTEATLSFIGIGVNAPRASWGKLIFDGKTWMGTEPHLVIFPAIAIALTLLSFTWLGDGLRDALDPKLKGKQ